MSVMRKLNYGTGFGAFNTRSTFQYLYFFDEPSNMTFEQWNASAMEYFFSNMPSVIRSGPYPLDYRSNQDYWDFNLNDIAKMEILNIPNFDAKQFKRMTDIDVQPFINRCGIYEFDMSKLYTEEDWDAVRLEIENYLAEKENT